MASLENLNHLLKPTVVLPPRQPGGVSYASYPSSVRSAEGDPKMVSFPELRDENAKSGLGAGGGDRGCTAEPSLWHKDPRLPVPKQVQAPP